MNEDPEVVSEVGKLIVDALDDVTFEVVGSLNAATLVKKPNPESGQPDIEAWRTKPTLEGQSFFLASVRIGAKKEMLFRFEPEDYQEYLCIEVKANNVDKFFPLAGGELAKVVDDVPDSREDFLSIVSDLLVAAYEVKAIAELNKINEMAEDEDFGMF